jgi:Metallo-peptidase family M12B Reprolysin-like
MRKLSWVVPRARPTTRRRRRPPQFERLEPRSLLAADLTSDPFASLLTHGGPCSCPICSGTGLELYAQAQAAAAPSSAAIWTPSATPTGVPLLSSRPGAPATLYLDFNGHVESQWGDRANIVTPPYDIDGNPTSFSALEVANLREIWARVAEDFAPLNINVTTIAPASFADRVGARMAIGGNYSDWFGGSAGGVAYVGGFANGASNVGYVFEDALGNGNPKYVAEATSHEAGHLFGLAHQSEWSGGQLVTEYHAGNADWAPLMGVGYYADRTTWTNGPTAAGPSPRQDDLSILAGASNGFGYVPDDYGGTLATAAALPLTGSSVRLAGLIGKNDDRDLFRFSTGGGPVSFTLDAAPIGANLDGVLELVNASGVTIATANSADSYGASLDRTLGAGTYYLMVRSSGGYGNIGRYTLRGTASAGTVAQPPTPPAASPEIVVQVNGTNLTDGGTIGFGNTAQHAPVTRTVTIRNQGGGTLRLSPLGSALPPGFSLVSNITATTLAAGQSTSFTLRLHATQPGTFLGEIALASSR